MLAHGTKWSLNDSFSGVRYRSTLHFCLINCQKAPRDQKLAPAHLKLTADDCGLQPLLR